MQLDSLKDLFIDHRHSLFIQFSAQYNGWGALYQTHSSEVPKDLLAPATFPAGGKFDLEGKTISEESSTQLYHR